MPSHGIGPIPARVMIVGEFYSDEDLRLGEPFTGEPGREMNRMLQEAGIMRSECYTTNVVNARPFKGDLTQWIAFKKKDISLVHVSMRDRYVLPLVVEGYQSLLTEIEMVQPNVIVACGNLALWALTGQWGILKWRGSVLQTDSGIKVIPMLTPAAVVREWSQRMPAVQDLRRVRHHMLSKEYTPPQYRFIVQPDLATVEETLGWLFLTLESGVPLWLDFDLETRLGHISCVGVSWSSQDAICIPLMSNGNRSGYWTLEEEAWIVWTLWKITCHPRAQVRWQNGLYDAQYTYRHWLFIPRGVQDTMISQHSLFSDLPKSLAFQASVYANNYVYWKDEGKDFNTGGREEKKGWVYNCLDCVYTREVGEMELQLIKQHKLEEVHERQQKLFWPVLTAMIRGVKIDLKRRQELIMEVQDELNHRQAAVVKMLGHDINPRSSKQMCTLFYEDLRQQPIMTRAKKGVPGHLTCDDEALQKIAAREPLLMPIVNAIADTRTLGVFLSSFLLKPLDVDQRMRCSYNIGGSASGKSAPKTFRLSSNENAFGSGTNLQNIPSEKSKSVGKALARTHTAMLGDPLSLPNIRSIFIPDPGFTFFDMDLDRADLQVVVWEADDAMLKAALRMGADIHLLNAFALDDRDPPPLEELVESHPRYSSHRGPLKHKREFAKVFCHATNYGGGPRTIAGALGRTVHEVDKAQKLWFGAHPGVKKWHERVKDQILRHRFVENKFGYRWYIFDRLDMVLPEAIAWIPQSTVSNVINEIWQRVYDTAPEVEVNLQVHDSLAGQFPTHRREPALAHLRRCSQVVIPYDEPLTIPTGIKTSTVSWGDCA